MISRREKKLIKKVIILIVLFSIFLVTINNFNSSNINVTASDGSITIVSPYSSDTWYVSDTNTISWISDNPVSYVDIDLYQDGYFYSIIFESVIIKKSAKTN